MYRVILHWVLLLACLLLLQGCGVRQYVTDFLGGEDNTEPPAELVEFEPTLEVATRWSKRIGRGAHDYYLRLTPTVTEDRVYTVARDGVVTALNNNNGSTIWETRTREPLSSPPGVGDALVVVGTSRGEVLALDRDSGKEMWRARVTSEVLAAPQTAGGIVAVRCGDGNLFGLDAESGDRVWLYNRSVPALSLRGNSAPVIDRTRGLVIVGFDEGRLTAIDLRSGRPTWETRVASASGRSELERMVDINADPVIHEGVVYVTTYQGRVAAINLVGGNTLWSRDIPSHAGLTVDDSRLYITDDTRHVWALELFSGSSLWKLEELQARATTAPAVIGSYLVVGDIEGYVHWVNKEDGEFVARVKIDDSPVLAAPITMNNTVYVYSQGGTLSAYTYR